MEVENSNELQCPACYKSSKQFRGNKNGFDIFLCKECKTLYSSKNISSQNFDYDSYYHEGNLAVPDFVALRLREIVQTFEKYRQKNSFLDVGCGAGTLLKAAISEGWKAEGVEISKSAVEYLRAENIKVFNGDLCQANFAENSFDVVTAVEILEHISSPNIILKEIHRILRPGGLLWATTPHGNGATGKLLGAKWTCVAPPEHLHLFSVKGIKNLLTEAGFRNVRVSTQGVNPFEIIHALRYGNESRQSAETSMDKQASEPNFDRVDTAYKLNSALSKSTSRRAVKNFLNNLLDISRLGDSLKIWAEK